MNGWERVACDLCGSCDHAELFEIHESPDPRQPPAWRGTAAIPVVRCRRCGLIFLNPRYDDSRLRALYQDPQMFTQSTDPDGRTRSIADERSERIAAFGHDVGALRQHRRGGRLLDVGTGLGFFLEALGGDYDAIGLEWSHSAVAMGRDRGVSIVEARFPEHPFASREFDVVTLHHVLDHFPQPLAALTAARELLKPDGLLMLTLVNVGSLAARVYGRGFRLLAPNHLHYFTPETIRTCLQRACFVPLSVEFPYFGTPVARPVAHSLKLFRDWWALTAARTAGVRVSPPFYGNVMRVLARAA